MLTPPRLGLTFTSSLVHVLFFVPFLIYSCVSYYSTFCSFDIISCPFNVISHLPTSHCCGSAVCLSEWAQ